MSVAFDVPILFLIFNRPDTTRLVFEEIKKIRPKRLYVAADGPRKNHPDEMILCKQARSILNEVDWDCQVYKLFRDNNLGCGEAINTAIDWFFENVEEGIVLEDDCVPNASFFKFCELMLEKYRSRDDIGIISGSNYLFESKIGENKYFRSQFFPIWGWATWSKVWNKHRKNKVVRLRYSLVNKLSDSNLKNFYQDQFYAFNENYVDTWDIPFVYNLVKDDYLSIIPGNNLISNIGLVGTHSSVATRVHGLSTKEIDFDRLTLIQDEYLFKKINEQVYENINKHNKGIFNTARHKLRLIKSFVCKNLRNF